MRTNICFIIIFGIFFLSSCKQNGEGIPFSEALNSARINLSGITEINTEAVVLGTGDMNALLWEDKGELRMRITKNDIWDARINTSKDPELLQMDIKNRTWEGGAKRSGIPTISWCCS